MSVLIIDTPENCYVCPLRFDLPVEDGDFPVPIKTCFMISGGKHPEISTDIINPYDGDTPCFGKYHPKCPLKHERK